MGQLPDHIIADLFCPAYLHHHFVHLQGNLYALLGIFLFQLVTHPHAGQGCEGWNGILQPLHPKGIHGLAGIAVGELEGVASPAAGAQEKPIKFMAAHRTDHAAGICLV